MEELMSVFCWCGREVVRVPASVIRANQTRECGRGCLRRYEERGVQFPVVGSP